MALNHRPVRRAQLISPFGVGSMVDFPADESLMAAGLDAWPFAEEDCPAEWKIVEERLSRRLGVKYFRAPPDFRSDDVSPEYARQYVPFVRFPRWLYCPDRACGRLFFQSLFGGGTPRCLDDRHLGVQDSRRPKLIPVRFVAICPKGHIEDFPFLHWVHRGNVSAELASHRLYYKSGRSAALSGINIQCSCGLSRSMAGAFAYGADEGGPLSWSGYRCRGSRPWLGRESTELECEGHLRVVQRGGSNVYFAKTFSSIYLPLWAEGSEAKIVKVLEDPRIWEMLKSGLIEGRHVQDDRCDAVAALRGVDAAALKVAAQRKLDGAVEEHDATEEDYRFSEYEAFRGERGGPHTDLLSESRPISEYESWAHQYFERICLIRKLRETRALAGFSRLVPPGSGEVSDSDLQPLAANHALGWLPAMVVRGEGIFIEFRREKIAAWEKDPEVIKRVADHASALNRARVSRGLPHQILTPKFVLLHTFAHLLIRQLSFDCGYGSAALRERLYCNLEQNDREMQGILIYTAAGDSEGTMGGLVRKGEHGNLEESLRNAIGSALWCSSDPVCAESRGQGTDSANLAACHGCALLPETSCEQGNRLLDRVLVANALPDEPRSFFALV